MDEKNYITVSAAQTQSIGKDIATQLRGGDSVALYGDLGSGKTTLAQGIADGLGITSRVTSPTFLILKSYQIPEAKEINTLYHIDAYRLENEKDGEEMGFSEVFLDTSAVAICEWPERINNKDFNPRIIVHCEYREENKRSISVAMKDLRV